MRLFTNTLHYDNVFFMSIFQLNEKKMISKILPKISHSANGYYYPFIPILLYFLSKEKAVHFLIAALISFALELPLCTIMKHGIKRGRPFEILEGIHFRISPGDQFSLPSGHTAAAFVMTVLLSCFYPVLLLPALTWALLVGVSRIYLGVHYPTDVLAGMILGTLSGLSGILLAADLY